MASDALLPARLSDPELLALLPAEPPRGVPPPWEPPVETDPAAAARRASPLTPAELKVAFPPSSGLRLLAEIAVALRPYARLPSSPRWPLRGCTASRSLACGSGRSRLPRKFLSLRASWYCSQQRASWCANWSPPAVVWTPKQKGRERSPSWMTMSWHLSHDGSN
ncbi:hypothetical protein DFJ74DRAFT_694464 [Hyaloraphidium curvatum]|nr:hypothetical protein DFJ74DRAFT_694464 [Hyaloraphidium curvatum]